MNSNGRDSDLTIGLALGSGSARGWSHIGIISALEEFGIVPDVVCGTSIGALVGASYVSNNLKKLEEQVCSLTKFDTARFFEISFSLSGFVNIEKLHDFLVENIAGDEAEIGGLSKQYAAVATELESGREVWLTDGSIIEAVWASISLPGLFPAIKSDNKWLVDGGLVNPVPVSVCRALGADIVIAVNLNGDIVGKHFVKSKKLKSQDEGVKDKITGLVKGYTGSLFSNNKDEDRDKPPGLFDAIAGSINIVQSRITRSRMAGDPPDILLSPKLSDIGLLEFYRAGEAISEGRRCVQRMGEEIQHVFEMGCRVG